MTCGSDSRDTNMVVRERLKLSSLGVIWTYLRKIQLLPFVMAYRCKDSFLVSFRNQDLPIREISISGFRFLQQLTVIIITWFHRWALSPISVIGDIGLSLIQELPISDWESRVRHYIGYRIKVLSDIRYPTSTSKQTVTVVWRYSARLPFQGAWVGIWREVYIFFLQCRI
jgi:hypothetical protein